MDLRVGLWRKLSAKELTLLKCGVGEDSWESLGLQGDPTSPSYRKSVLNIHWKDWCWSWSSSTLATWCKELTHWKWPYTIKPSTTCLFTNKCDNFFGHLMQRRVIGKDPNAGKDWRQQEKGMTEDEMVGWHHRLNGHQFKQAPGVGDGQGSLVCCSPWGHKELDTTELLNWADALWASQVAQL